MNQYDEIIKDDEGLEMGSVHTHHNGLSVVWTFEVAGGPQATLSYQTRKAAFFGLMRVAMGKPELIAIRKAQEIALLNVTKGCAHVVNGKVIGVVTNVRTEDQGEGELVYLTFDYFTELVFDADDTINVVE
jgi:hypothetical protein